MAHATDYKVIYGMFTDHPSQMNTFQNAVIQALHEGFELHGSPFTLGDKYICQAVIKSSMRVSGVPAIEPVPATT